MCSSCGTGLSSLTTGAAQEPPTERGAPPPVPIPERRRFQTGDVIASRYRMVERIGQGGMGEVYRADDLTLDQPVALKFLPQSLSADPRSLRGLKQEVRIARQISHPYVCRVYDITESEGGHFLSMEYVRGEDLRSLLLRVGRLPPERAAQVAWQIASGLMAAHEKGVLHRDLKPANIMLDELGRVRIMDFGLAAAAGSVAPAEIPHGTPAFMAPEQAAGREVTTKSDLYSLGLVLYLLFTGRTAHSEEGTRSPRRPSEWVAGISPAVDSMILACLRIEPDRRPASAMAVRAAFAEGDMLALAVERGETPRPELVAEAGDFLGLAPAVAWSGLLFVAASIALSIWAPLPRLSSLVPLPNSPPVLVADARAALDGLGYRGQRRDSTYGFLRDGGYIDSLMAGPRAADWWSLLRRGEPSVIRFWYRESPLHLVPDRTTEFVASPNDPPASVPGMAGVELDTRGRLRRLEVVPDDRDSTSGSVASADWAPLFAAADLDPAAFAPTEPRWFPSVYADERAAWEGRYPDAPEVPIRLEAAALRGRIVSFRVVEPWSHPAAESSRASRHVSAAEVVAEEGLQLLHIAINGALLLGLGLVARRNLRTKRGDTFLASRLASVLFGLVMIQWLLEAHHVPQGAELDLFFGALYRAFFTYGLGWLFYIAIEPYARSLWPRSLTSWVRLLHGRFQDPQVGRDLLIGCVFGTGHGMAFGLAGWAPLWQGHPPARPDLGPHPAELLALLGVRDAIAAVAAILVSLTTHVLYLLVALILFKFLLRRTWLAVAVHWLAYVSIFSTTFGLFAMISWITFWHIIFFRYGFLPILSGSITISLLAGFPLTTDMSAWHAYATWIPALACFGLTLYAFRASLGTRPVFRDLLDEP